MELVKNPLSQGYSKGQGKNEGALLRAYCVQAQDWLSKCHMRETQSWLWRRSQDGVGERWGQSWPRHQGTEPRARAGRAFSLPSQLPAKPRSARLFTFPPLIAASLKHIVLSLGCSRAGTFCLGRTPLFGASSGRTALNGLEQTEPEVDAVIIQVLSGCCRLWREAGRVEMF